MSDNEVLDLTNSAQREEQIAKLDRALNHMKKVDALEAAVKGIFADTDTAVTVLHARTSIRRQARSEARMAARYKPSSQN